RWSRRFYRADHVRYANRKAARCTLALAVGISNAARPRLLRRRTGLVIPARKRSAIDFGPDIEAKRLPLRSGNHCGDQRLEADPGAGVERRSTVRAAHIGI